MEGPDLLGVGNDLVGGEEEAVGESLVPQLNAEEEEGEEGKEGDEEEVELTTCRRKVSWPPPASSPWRCRRPRTERTSCTQPGGGLVLGLNCLKHIFIPGKLYRELQTAPHCLWFGKFYHGVLLVLFGVEAWEGCAHLMPSSSILSYPGAGVSVYPQGVSTNWA